MAAGTGQPRTSPGPESPGGRQETSAVTPAPRRPGSGDAPSPGSRAAGARVAPGEEREPRFFRLPGVHPATSGTRNLPGDVGPSARWARNEVPSALRGRDAARLHHQACSSVVTSKAQPAFAAHANKRSGSTISAFLRLTTPLPPPPGAPVLPSRAPHRPTDRGDRGDQFVAQPHSHPVHTEEKGMFREGPLGSEKFSVQKERSPKLTEAGKDAEGAQEQERTRSPRRKNVKGRSKPKRSPRLPVRKQCTGAM